MKFSKIILGALALCMTAAAFGQTAEEIAKKVHDLPDGDTNYMVARLTLTDKSGKSRVREIAAYKMEEGTTKKSVTVFRTPKDVAGVSYLSFDYPDNPDGTTKDSDSWLYLPAMKKARRVSGSSKDDDFQGTDFTYDDIGERSLGKDTFKILGSENVGGKDCWMLEYTAKNANSKITRRVMWIDKSNYTTLKGEYYDRQGKKFKELLCESIEQVDGFWTIKKMTMSNIVTSHKTVYELLEVKYNLKVDANLFTVSALEREMVK
jgi:outer membrane lipoprotein-sorting protein